MSLAVLFVIQIHVFNSWAGLGAQLPLRTAFNIGLAALLFGPAVLFKKKLSRYVYLAVVQLVVSVIFVSQYLYFAYSGSFLQSSVIRYVLYAGDVASSVKTLPIGPLFFFGNGLAVLAVLVWLDLGRGHIARRPRHALATIAALFGLGLGLVCWADIRRFGDVSRIFVNPYDNASLIKKVGIVGYGGLDLRRYAATPRGINAEEKQFVLDWAAKNPKEITASKFFGTAKGKNLIFVQSESLERFVIGRRVGGQEITPNLNRFINESLYFPNFYYTIGPGHTVDAEFVVNNSLLPLQDRVTFFEYPQHEYQTLAGQIKSTGYRPMAFHANSGSFWNRTAAYPKQGFDQFISKNQFAAGESIGWGLSDKEFFRQSVGMLKDSPKPFYAYMVSLTQHVPFDLPAGYQKLNIDDSLGLDWIQENYLQISHYYDSAFGQLISELKSAGLYENSVIVLDGDHTAFIEKQNDLNFARFLGYEEGFTRQSYIQNTQVPLLIHIPGGPTGSIDTPGGHLDVYPTLANLLGIRAPGSVLGHDLLNTAEPVGISLRFNTKLIDALEGKDLFYISSEAGDFESGTCLRRKTNQPVLLAFCRPMYEDVQAKLRISELVIRGNAVQLLNIR